jgi:hypothetical protein
VGIFQRVPNPLKLRSKPNCNGEQTIEFVPNLEKRLVLRLLSHWRDSILDHPFPTLEELGVTTSPELWDHSFIINLGGNADEAVIQSAGPGFAAHSQSSFIGRRLSLIPANTLIAKSVEYLSEVLEKEVPVSRGGEFINGDGITVLYRSILLPVGSDQQKISAVLGAANCSNF